jgi:hypothetical protein
LFFYTVIISAAPQETVRDAGIEPGTAVLQFGEKAAKKGPSKFFLRIGQYGHKKICNFTLISNM